MSTRTRWECYECNGKGTQSKKVEKVQPDDRSVLNRVFRRPPPPPEVVWVQEKCSRCGGTEVLTLSLEEVQRLEDQHQEERRTQLERWGFAVGPKMLVINPIDQPTRPPEPDPHPTRTHRCSKCGYTAPYGAFPQRKNTVFGGDEELTEPYCPKCGKGDPEDISPRAPKRNVNWDSFGEPRDNLKPGSGLKDCRVELRQPAESSHQGESLAERFHRLYPRYDVRVLPGESEVTIEVRAANGGEKLLGMADVVKEHYDSDVALTEGIFRTVKQIVNGLEGR